MKPDLDYPSYATGSKEARASNEGGVEPGVTNEVHNVLYATDGVEEVTEIRIRWGRLLAEVNLAIRPELSVEKEHQIAQEAHYRLMHHLQYLPTPPCTSIRLDRQERHTTREPPTTMRTTIKTTIPFRLSTLRQDLIHVSCHRRHQVSNTINNSQQNPCPEGGSGASVWEANAYSDKLKKTPGNMPSSWETVCQSITAILAHWTAYRRFKNGP